MAGEAEDNIVVETPVLDRGVGNTPSPAPKPEPEAKPPVVETDEQKAEAAKAAEAQAAKDAEAAKAAEEANKDDDDDTEEKWNGEYITFNDPAAQSVVNLLNEAKVSGIEANDIFKDAIEADDPSKIKWDVLEAKIGKDKTNLAKIGFKDYFDRVYSQNRATTKTVFEVVGGQENWGKIAKWVQKAEKADPSRKAEFDELRKGIDAGGRFGKAAAEDFRKLYEADPKNSGLGGSKVQSGDKPPAKNEQALSRADYLVEVRKLGDNPDPATYAALRARRVAGLNAGI